MNNKEAIRREKLYYDGLEKAIAQPIPKEYAKELENIIKDEDTFDEAKMTLTFWKEVVAPLEAPSLRNDMAVGMTPHEQSGSGIPSRAALTTEPKVGLERYL